jgi:ADP-heptose:LPS heptosyltransferase
MDFKKYWTPQVPPLPGGIHSLDYLANEMERLLGITITPEQRKPRLTLRPAARVWASRFWADNDLDAHSGRVVGLVPSSNMIIKRWPLAKWLALDEHLRERGYRTILFCDRPDGSVQRAFAQAGSDALPVYTTLDNVAALLTHCDLIGSVDTGLLHMAGALDVPWVGLFGPTNPEVTGPYDRTGGTALVAPFPKQPTCASCWKHFKYEKDLCYTLPQGSCLDYLDEADVLAACLQILSKAESSVL